VVDNRGSKGKKKKYNSSNNVDVQSIYNYHGMIVSASFCAALCFPGAKCLLTRGLFGPSPAQAVTVIIMIKEQRTNKSFNNNNMMPQFQTLNEIQQRPEAAWGLPEFRSSTAALAAGAASRSCGRSIHNRSQACVGRSARGWPHHLLTHTQPTRDFVPCGSSSSAARLHLMLAPRRAPHSQLQRRRVRAVDGTISVVTRFWGRAAGSLAALQVPCLQQHPPRPSILARLEAPGPCGVCWRGGGCLGGMGIQERRAADDQWHLLGGCCIAGSSGRRPG
jgi:hypothetical protein